ncbi:MAG: SDR family NAD(P)-dependent oxidoreductase [Dermatophilaceae bacterium]|mgnify:CR=1 FL=1
MTEIVERTVHTHTAPGMVSAYLADFRNAVEWDAGTVSCDLVSGDGGPGSHYRNVSRFAGRAVELDYVLEEASAQRIRLTGRAGPTTAHDTITIRPDGAGGSQVDYHAEFEFGLAARLAAPVVRLLLDRLADDTAATLAAALDARATHPSQPAAPTPDMAGSLRHRSDTVTGSPRRVLGAASDRALDLLVVPGFTRLGSAVRARLPGYPCDPAPGALAGQHIAITGASTGIGAAAARGVSALGAHVHLIVRDVAKGQGVADTLSGPGTVWRCDVADLTSVAAFTRKFRSAGIHLHGLVHNAGAMPAAYERSPQGHELTMALHVLGPVAMTDALAPLLRDGRVVFVSSGGMYLQGLRADDPAYTTEDYRPTRAYARSKRAQVELLPHLQKRWGDFGISVSAMHPGWSDTPGVVRSLPGFARLTGPLLRSAEDGADTIVWLLARPEDGPRARLWHDRQVRPTSRFPVRGASDAGRAQLSEWLEEALRA